MSRHDSFDHKLDIKTVGHLNAASNGSGKRRRKSRSSSNSSVIAGNVGSGIGSPRNMTEPLDDGRYLNPIRNASSFEQNLNADQNQRRPSRRHLNVSSHSINRNTIPIEEIQIPIHRVDSNFDRRNYQIETININEYPDPRVAYRLASNE